MNTSSRRRWIAAVGALSVVGAFASVSPASAASVDRGKFTATPLAVASRVDVAKSASGKAAQSDKTLLGRTDGAMVNVVIKLDYDALAAYTGDVRGLAATSPAQTKKRLTGKSAAEVAYDKHVTAIDASVRSAIKAKVPSAKLGRSLKVVYGGIVAKVPARDAAKLLTVAGVAAVQSDTVNQPERLDEAPQFMGANALWKQLGGQKLAGQGVIFADLDSGVWPEHEMLADNGSLGAPPAAPSGLPRACDFGDNPLTPATDVFACNNKLIGGEAFLDTYLANNPTETYTTARDSDGHGTHTTTTAAGNWVKSAKVFGVERGPISGVAPGAWVIEYKVCGAAGCYGSDTAAAVQQAILDGATVLNYSISGGVSPYGDPTELAFLDAYKAGVFVAASAGNSGPTAATVNHLSPWTTTVAASTQRREFQSTLTLTAGADTATFTGASITGGITAPTEVVLAQDIAGYDALCSTALPAGAAEGKIVACRRGVVGRVQKGFNVQQGGAVGMILYNLPLQDIETDNHWLPAVHLADGTDFLAWMTGKTGVQATFTAGVATRVEGNVMAAFSSRGPGGQFLKPDITAPGVQVLAGQTPTPDDVAGGPAGEYYMAIAGTSMSSPNVAGSAILVKSLKSSWGPGEIKSALMTTARQNVRKEDLTTPADPFDFGAGHVDLTKVARAPIVFTATGADMMNLGQDNATAINLNLPSVNLPTMPGSVTVTRTARNISGAPYTYRVETEQRAGQRVTVTPATGTIPAGGSQTFTIIVESRNPVGQYFSAIRWVSSGNVLVRVPVAFEVKQGATSLTSACDPATITVDSTTTCTVTARNNGGAEASASLFSAISGGAKIVSATGATVDATGRSASAGPVTLVGPKDAVPAIGSATDTPAGGFLDLAAFGVAPQPVGDETALNFTVPAFTFGGQTFTRIGVVSNGYLVLGGTNGSTDVSYLPQNLPDPVRPNGVLAPYWSDLDGTGQPGIRATTLTDGVNTWLAIQWDVAIFGDSTPAGKRAMQVWIGLNGTDDISYEFADGTIGATTPAGTGLTVGVENVTGSSGAMISGPPAESYRVTTTPGAPGESVSYTLEVRGLSAGQRTLTTTMTADNVTGTTTVRSNITVN